MNWEGGGEKKKWRNLRYYLSICSEGLRKTTKNLVQDSRSPGRDLNPWPPEHEAGVLSIRLWRSLYTTVIYVETKENRFIPLNLKASLNLAWWKYSWTLLFYIALNYVRVKITSLYVRHCSWYEIRLIQDYTTFRSWLYSRVQVFGCHYTNIF
jgi:hypothetical protein